MLKTETVRIESLDEDIELRELSAKAFSDSQEEDRGVMRAVISCKYGVVAWSDRSVDEIAESEPMRVITEIAYAVAKLSGAISEDDSKN